MKINRKKILATVLSLMIFLPLLVSAASTNPLIPAECTGSDPSKCDFNSLIQLINNAINWFIGISVAIAAITFTIAGANILLHPDNAEKIKEAKSMFSKTVIGMLIVLGAWLIIHTVVVALVNQNVGALRYLGS